jgi:NADPH:quinone reductase
VIATAGTEEKQRICKQHGADYVLDYTKPGWQKQVLKITGGKGVGMQFE